ncbi:hypothetical protein CEB3_c17640 [Peptococcaceae bacterium CEB3]|nr:hypothetical protein CEB3_c17640 [Peptococcaceae bacterium CEB3]
MKRRILLPVMTLLFFILSLSPAYATTYTAPAPVYVAIIQPTDGGPPQSASTQIVWGDEANNTVALSQIQFHVALQGNSYVKVNYYSQSGTLLSSNQYGPYGSYVYAPLDPLTDYAPTNAYGVDLELCASSSGGGNYAWISQATNVQNNVTNFPTPSDSQLSTTGSSGGSGSGGTCTL